MNSPSVQSGPWYPSLHCRQFDVCMSQTSSLQLEEQGRQLNPPSSLSQPDKRHCVQLTLLDLNFNVQFLMIHLIAGRHFKC